ncbi:MAG: hypothetical protein ACOYN0_09190 [Phycisphaerales bacterium]
MAGDLQRYRELALLAALRHSGRAERLAAHHPEAARLYRALTTRDDSTPSDLVWREVLEVVARPDLPKNPPALLFGATYYRSRQLASTGGRP